MKFHILVCAAVAACGLASIGFAQRSAAVPTSRAAVEQRFQSRAEIYELLLADRTREALEQLLALPSPEGISKDLFLVEELTRLSLEFRNAQEPEAAARVATIARDLLSPDNVSKLQSRAERGEAWRLRARIHELILPDSNAARAAWQRALGEEPGDKRSADAIRRIDERAAHAQRQREEIARDPMGPGFVPTPAPPTSQP